MSSIVPKSFESAFDGKRDNLRKKLKVKGRLLVLLQNEGLIDGELRKALEAKHYTDEAMATELMDELERGDDSKVDVFLKCLLKDSQRHVVDIILGGRTAEWECQSTQGGAQSGAQAIPSVPATTNTMSAKEQVRDILDKALSVLCVELDVDHGLFTQLLSHGALTSEQIEECQTAGTSSNKVETMVKLLKRSPLSSYAKFRETLSSKDVNRDDLVKAYFPEILP